MPRRHGRISDEALNLGELVAKLRLDAREWKASNKEAEATFRGLTAKLGALAAAAGVAVALAFGATLLKGMDEWDLGAKLAAQFGGGQEAAAAYGHQIGQIYADNFGESIDQVAEALTAVMRATDDLVPSGSPEEIDKITKSALTLNQVFGYETPASVRAVQQMIRNGLVPDAQSGFDLIASAASKGIDKSEDLLDTFNEYSTMFRDLGIDGQQAMGLISQGLRAGARDADTVADALKEFAIRAQDGSTASAAGYKMLGLNAERYTAMAAKGGDSAAHALEIVLTKLRNTTDPVKRNAAAVALFGTKAEDLGDALFALDMDKASGEMAGFAGTVDSMAATLAGTPKQKIIAFWRTLQQGAVDVITAKVLPALSGLIDWITGSLVPALQSAGGWIERNSSWLGLLASMLGGAALAIGVIAGAMKVWAMATAAYTAVQWLLNAAMDANPIGIVIVAIAALVAGIIYAYTHFEGFRRVVDTVFGAVKTVISAVVDWIVGTAWPFLQKAWAGIAAGAMWLWHNVIEPVANGIGTAIRFVAGIVMWLVGVVRTVGSGIAIVFAFVMRIVTSVANLFLWLGQKVVGPIIGLIIGYFRFLGAIIAWLYQNAALPVFNAIATAVRVLGGVFAWLYENGIKAPFNWIVNAFLWVWAKVSPIFEKIKTAVAKVGATFKSIFNAIAGYIRGAFNNALDIAKGAINGIIGLVNGAIGFINRNMIDGLNHVPGVNFPHIPTLPKLAKGGVVQPTAGGTPVIMGDGGEVEHGIPRSDLESIIQRAVAATSGGGFGGGALELTLILHDTAQNRITRRTARVQGGRAEVLVGGV
jgi:phage-related minor tail protein